MIDGGWSYVFGSIALVVYYFFDVRWFDLSFDADQGIVASIGCQDYQFADDVFVNTYHYFRAVALFVGIDHCFVIRVFQFLDGSAEIVFDGIAAFLERKDFDAFYTHRLGEQAAYFHQERADCYVGYVFLLGKVVEQLVHALAISCLAE